MLVTAPKTQAEKEWRSGSGVSGEIVNLNLQSIKEPKEIASLLNWKHYSGSGGWYVKSIDLVTGQHSCFGQFKPDIALTFPNQEKAQKYISFPKGEGVEIILLLPDMETWFEIADRYQVPITPSDIIEDRLDKGFWLWVVDNPQLPLEITEGAKKAGCLLSNNYIPLCVTGVWNGKEKKKLKAIPTLAPFLTNGRPIHLVFDSDIVVKHQVQEALKHTGYLASKQGCIVGVATWEYSEATKGVDDLIVNKGIEEFEFVMDNLIPYKEWLKTIEKQFRKQQQGLIRLDSRQLMDYVRAKYRDRLKLNKLQQKIELDGKEICLDYAYLLLAEYDGIDCTKTKASDILGKIAEENVYNPVITYLDTVASAIAPVSLDSLATRYFGTENPIYNIFLKRTLIAAVARAYEPGCKHDTTLVLQGLQGAGKSSFFNTLGGKWFDDSMGNGSTKDDLIILHKSWIHEWGEIERTFSKRQSEELKAFLTRRSDTFRPPYGRSALEFPRQSIIVGTANGSDFLVDSTGNRRYWIIPVAKKKINIKQLAEERDRIWSAAVKAYRNGEKWWLTDEEEKLSQQNNQQFQIIDEWQSAIAQYLEGREMVSIMEILTRVFEIEPGKVDRRTQMRVGNILTNLAWKKVGQKQHQGKRQVVWKPLTIPQLKTEELERVLQPEPQIQQGLSIPTIPEKFNSQITEGKKENNHVNKNNGVQSIGSIADVAKVERVGEPKHYTRAKNQIIPPSKETNWLDYPYNSRDRYTLENRANKVKERILNCTTNNELNQLLFSRQGTEVELNWLVENYLTETEVFQLRQIQNSTQGNLFLNNESQASLNSQAYEVQAEQADKDHSESANVVVYEYQEIIAEIDSEMERLGWSIEQGQKYLSDRYNQKSRLHLSDEELIEFWIYLSEQRAENNGKN
jgi:predicted P-loop ATPase